MTGRSYANQVTNLSVSLQWDRGRGWWLAGILLSGAALLAGGDSVRESLRYERAAIGAGQWWRLFSAHAVHQDAHHFALNALGLVLVWALFARDYRARGWLCIVVASALGISLGLWWCNPAVQWYLGSSGVLHATMAAGCVSHLARRQWDGWLLGGALLAKLLVEQLRAPDSAAPLPVIVDAHLYGAIVGATMGAALCIGAVIMRRSSGRG